MQLDPAGGVTVTITVVFVSGGTHRNALWNVVAGSVCCAHDHGCEPGHQANLD